MNLLKFFIIFFLSSCSFFESGYEILIKDVRAQKLKEKKLGVKSPIIDGKIEPDFPDEDENIKTFEGIDSNNDGIRDDIEIWINRISEDKEVRIATKYYYKMQYKFILGVKNNVAPEVNTYNLQMSGNALFCLHKAFGENYKKYLNTTARSIDLDRSDNLLILFKNSLERREAFLKSEHAPMKGYLSIESGKEYTYCSPDNNLEYLKKEWQ